MRKPSLPPYPWAMTFKEFYSLYKQSDQFAAGTRHNESVPEAISRVTQQAIEASSPKARYLAAIAFSGRLVLHLRDFVWDFLLRRIFMIQEPYLPDKPVPS